MRDVEYDAYAGTVAENVRYGPQLKGKKLSDEEVRRLLITADLDASFMNKKGSELSVGQAQRVALARTLANSPEVISDFLIFSYFCYYNLFMLLDLVNCK